MKKTLILAMATFAVAMTAQAAPSMSERLAGKILLQVEQKGEAWYVNPDTAERHFMGRPADAFALMRSLGIGISNADIDKIPLSVDSMGGADTDGDGLPDAAEDAMMTDKNLADSDGDGYNDADEVRAGYSPNGPGRLTFDTGLTERLKGKILLQVERHGEAWYVNPEDGRRHFLGRPDDAFRVMRLMGLGITDSDLGQIRANGEGTGQAAAPAQAESPQAAAPAALADDEVRFTFVNSITGRPVPGHSIYCSGCLGYDRDNPFESDLAGQIVVSVGPEEMVSASKLETDWNNYDAQEDVPAGSDVTVNVTPQVVGEGKEIFFPETTYERGMAGQARLKLTYRNASGEPVADTMVQVSGPVVGSSRARPTIQTDETGSATVDLPINGAYRMMVTRSEGDSYITDFYQFEAPTGYDTVLIVDLSRKDEMISGTASLSKNYLERGMNLACVRDETTDEPVPIFYVSVPHTNTLYTKGVRHGDDYCIEVPQGVETFSVLATDTHKSVSNASSSDADENGIILLYAEAK